ncbi:MAG: hypothetical protein KUG83_04680, partial [Gammaproteobacteria bacterium]|nr:hypothetical protein [Gammaproteobacteria bacterium]
MAAKKKNVTAFKPVTSSKQDVLAGYFDDLLKAPDQGEAPDGVSNDGEYGQQAEQSVPSERSLSPAATGTPEKTRAAVNEEIFDMLSEGEPAQSHTQEPEPEP